MRAINFLMGLVLCFMLSAVVFVPNTSAQDAGSDAATDAAAGDSGTGGTTGGTSGGGSGCSISHSSQNEAALGALLLLGAVAIRRRS